MPWRWRQWSNNISQTHQQWGYDISDLGGLLGETRSVTEQRKKHINKLTSRLEKIQAVEKEHERTDLIGVPYNEVSAQSVLRKPLTLQKGDSSLKKGDSQDKGKDPQSIFNELKKKTAAVANRIPESKIPQAKYKKESIYRSDALFRDSDGLGEEWHSPP